MLRLLIQKELKEIISSTKFVVTFGVCSILILLAFYTGARNHEISRAQYEASRTENLRQMEGLTDWMMVHNHRIFRTPEPLSTLITGISNDVGRSITVRGRGDLSAEDTRFNDAPVFAVFRFLDLDFIFRIVLSLFAILFAYDAVNGEKERGTLRLVFANAVPRGTYILGKLVGSFAALSVALLIPILLGCLLLPGLGVYLTGNEWLLLGLVILSGMLYFGVFLMLSVFMSSLTRRSSSSFLLLLVVWICSVLIIPRTAVLLAGRAVEVLSVDEIASQKSRLSRQLWSEDREKMAAFKPSNTDDPRKMMEEFQKMVQDNADEREARMNELSSRLAEARNNRMREREQTAFTLARLSPTAVFALAVTSLTGTSTALKDHFLEEAAAYQQSYAEFMKEKTGMNLGGGMVFRVREDGDQEKEEPIDPRELPDFRYGGIPVDRALRAALPEMGLLVLFNLVFFAGAFAGFMRFDLR